ncbi:carbohydrate-binding family 9-like protein [Paenibacillus sp. S150]|uniref:carbohydrate-binding family 9-like protein n=1 Tax=Paenibacillus sp. S150 TaxID=2749826 RepID=UPI001C56CFBA|nr:carbohydrate-binding family 9-like protein [Paenibacillus sp. S150]MBW4082582.1 carbohydrate-binding family 9-like protein [Paenibacillus sp. S150]
MKWSAVPEPDIEYAPRSYLCLRAEGGLTLDGRLDKAFWDKAPWTEDFVDIEGGRKQVPSKRTRVKMLWDDEYFYFGAELADDEIWATLTERDSVIFNDNDFEIFIDPDGDTHRYYEFEINALNTVWDLLLVTPYRDGGPPVNGWDIQGLRTAVHIDGELNNPYADNRSWSVEVAMPWSALKECAAGGRPPLAGECWRVNFSRVQWRVETQDGRYRKQVNPATGKPYPEDNWVWSPQGIVNMHYPELWGYVVFGGAGATGGEGQEVRRAQQPQHAERHGDFVLPPDELIKWRLRRLYYRQRNHYAEHGRFTDDLALLAQGETDLAALAPAIETGTGRFQLSAPSADGTERYWIREDGKLWKE